MSARLSVKGNCKSDSGPSLVAETLSRMLFRNLKGKLPDVKKTNEKSTLYDTVMIMKPTPEMPEQA